MFGAIGGWFSALSTIAKVGVITGASVATIGTASVVSNSQPPPTPNPGPASPKVEHKTVTTTEAVAFETKTVDDATLASGTDKTTTEGVAGVKTKTYDVTYTNGTETNRTLKKEEVTTQPVTKVIAHGTYVAPPTPNCTPGYSPCIAPGSDVDCAGGSGNGPRYVSGPVYVTGSDPYDLDRDGNGIGCE